MEQAGPSVPAQSVKAAMQFSMEREQRRRLGWVAMGGRSLFQQQFWAKKSRSNLPEK